MEAGPRGPRVFPRRGAAARGAEEQLRAWNHPAGSLGDGLRRAWARLLVFAVQLLVAVVHHARHRALLRQLVLRPHDHQLRVDRDGAWPEAR